MFDGYTLHAEANTKAGRVTVEMAESYEEFFINAQREFSVRGDQFVLIKSDRHLGFAMCVRNGLEMCTTEYALIVQHDRCFMRRFSDMMNVIACMDALPHIRYIGFPTVTSVNHENVMNTRYGLSELASSNQWIPISEEFMIKPLMFWYDSTHICRISRYLEIYKPFTYMHSTMKAIVGTKAIKSMIMKQGDFIEDRFGQAQRSVLASLKGRSEDAALCFMWFGSYLLSPRSVAVTTDLKNSVPQAKTIFVGHLRGRTFDPTMESKWKAEAQCFTSNCDREVIATTTTTVAPAADEIEYELFSLGNMLDGKLNI